MEIQDPSDLSQLYFSESNLSRESSNVSVNYVSPSISISTEHVAHGRGLIATKDIKEGELLFVTSPTISVDPNTAKQRMTEQNVPVSKLEEMFIDLLVENMHKCLQENVSPNILNSFLALMGTKFDVEKEIYSIETLLGQNGDCIFSISEVQEVSKSDLKNVILKNAFGPDFLTYEKIANYWNRHDEEREQGQFLPNLLGIFPLAAMLNHSCNGNAVRTYSNGIMIVHASKAITANEEILWSYIPSTREFMGRRRALKKLHRFVCMCNKCSIESKHLKRDILPLTLRKSIDESSVWNARLLDVENCDEDTKRMLCTTFLSMEETVFASASLSTDVKHMLRTDFTNFHFNFFNCMLSSLGQCTNSVQVRNVQDMILKVSTHLHFSFVFSNHASTEHLSLLHLCYDLANSIHRNNEDKSKSIVKVRFWTEQMKRVHQSRYGKMGDDVEKMRRLLVHTKSVLRQRDGMAAFNFL